MAERVRLGIIGVGNRGSQLLGWFLEQPDAEVRALCDVYKPYVERRRDAGSLARGANDHGVSKWEGRLRREAADRHGTRGAQDGGGRGSDRARRRGLPEPARRLDLSRACRAGADRPHRQGRLSVRRPRARRPYQVNLAPYYFRWWSDFSSQMGNWGVHYMDVIRWLTGEVAPSAVTAVGGRYAVEDDRDIPDTMTVLYEFASGRTVQFQINEASAGYSIADGEVELRGTRATLIADQNGYRTIPSRPGQFQDWDTLAEPEEKSIGGDAAFGDLGIKENSSANLVRNFLDCVKDRSVEPYCSLEDGHRSTCFAHLANISLATGARLLWDAEAERFTNSDEANEMLHYEYRAPWSLS